MSDDTRTIDALCRLQRGWSDFVDGSCEDYTAAQKIVLERAAKAEGTFREPTELERYRTCLQAIAGDDPSGKWGRWAREALTASMHVEAPE